MTRITFISDTHNQLSHVTIPECDLLIHCGDLTGRGTEAEIREEIKLLGQYKAKTILLTPGNHDWLFQNNEALAREICKENNVIPLIQESYKYGDINVYMSPITPQFYNWAYMRSRGKDIAFEWNKIPDNVNLLVTHGMPYGLLDSGRDYPHVGCQDLLARIKELKHLKWYAGGHLHEYGGTMIQVDGVEYINAAVCNEAYKPLNKIITIEV